MFQIPAGKKLPFQTTELSVYVQLAGGLGTWDVAVEMLQARDNGTRRSVGMTAAQSEVVFTTDNQLIPIQTAFVMKPVRFREAGVYEFRLVALTAAGTELLDGKTAQIRVLDRSVV